MNEPHENPLGEPTLIDSATSARPIVPPHNWQYRTSGTAHTVPAKATTLTFKIDAPNPQTAPAILRLLYGTRKTVGADRKLHFLIEFNDGTTIAIPLTDVVDALFPADPENDQCRTSTACTSSPPSPTPATTLAGPTTRNDASQTTPAATAQSLSPNLCAAAESFASPPCTEAHEPMKSNANAGEEKSSDSAQSAITAPSGTSAANPPKQSPHSASTDGSHVTPHQLAATLGQPTANATTTKKRKAPKTAEPSAHDWERFFGPGAAQTVSQ